MRILLQDPEAHDVLQAVVAHNPRLGPRLASYVYGSNQDDEIRARTVMVEKVTMATARALLLAKIARSSENEKVYAEFETTLRGVKEDPALRDLALSFVQAERETDDDAFRDPAQIPDALLHERIERIKSIVMH